jgi:hypothetical protein
VTRLGCLWALVKPVLLLAVIGALLTVAAFPWMIPLPGRDSLNGPWIGALRTNIGPEAWLLLSLQPSRTYKPTLFRGTPLGGDAVLCTASRRYDLFVSGGTTVWSGRSFEVLLQSPESSRQHVRLDIAGRWDGRVVEFTQRNVSLADMLSPSEAGSEPERSKFIAATLHKSSRADFDSMCRGLPAPRGRAR